MTTKYFVTKAETCATCKGVGTIILPIWEAYMDLNRELAFVSGADNPETRALWSSIERAFWNRHGYDPDNLPEQEATCADCSGKGRTVKAVELDVALADLDTAKSAPIDSAENVRRVFKNG